MSVRVRLTRVGSKKNPIWRVVVADQRSPRDGRFIEMIGQYNPQTHPSTIVIDQERLQHWLARGAQASGTVKQLMKAQAKSGAAAAGSGRVATTDSDEAPAPDSDEATAPENGFDQAPATEGDESPPPDSDEAAASTT